MKAEKNCFSNRVKEKQETPGHGVTKKSFLSDHYENTSRSRRKQ